MRASHLLTSPRDGKQFNRFLIPVELDVGLINKRGERFACLAGEVCKGLPGKSGEIDCKGVEAFAYIQFLADGIQFRGQRVDNNLRHANRSNRSEPGLHLEAL